MQYTDWLLRFVILFDAELLVLSNPPAVNMHAVDKVVNSDSINLISNI